MDRRSWLWRRKSSEKSPGETESSGSLSSHSERFSDEQAYPSQSTQSPEVTSKSANNDEEVNNSVKTLTEKLSAALLNISAKEELVKQHAKVAEEAVSGWENAENEVLSLKQQLEAAKKKNSALEDRACHLDGALKECVRQLRQAREEQEQKINEVVAKKTHEWESAKSELERQLVELQVQLQGAKAETTASVGSDLRPKLEAAEKENSALQLELLSRLEEIEIRIMERDLSTQAAETASKQHLESIKKVAKLEAECRRLKAMARKASLGNDHKSFSASNCVESFADSQSDCGERLLAVETDMCKISGLDPNECEPNRSDSWALTLVSEFDHLKNEKVLRRNLMVPSIEINLMDDFLEMERLVAMPDTESGSYCLETGLAVDQVNAGESHIKAELEAMIDRTAELEEKLEKLVAEKEEFKMALAECQKQFETSRGQLREAELKLVELQTQLALADKLKQATDQEVKATQTKRETAESQLRIVEAEVKFLLLKVSSSEEEVEKERALSAENVAKCQKLEDELLRIKREAEIYRDTELRLVKSNDGELKMKQEKELAVAASKFAECQKTIASLGQQLRSLATLEDFLTDSEKPLELTVSQISLM
ncbi:filament-like plant protein 3 isoform X2 [Juglans microcarpa x Juglans regia]|uniref:filament-like plant protein 3 isoform X2 n=1 Tax=Juglans microcarpa x Juglans regia TaxID=2249226 RepID=UPI001B7F6499|nr:filament-like plant protein 3 isoform X2 [Juglans microcarpa x Juglans regia]XP_041004908.1 filament-like plant protein 3 isoform X2 [Juglans microcarpa x Juglans regia]